MKLADKRKKTLNSEDKLMKVREFFQNDLIERHDIICRYCEKKSLKITIMYVRSHRRLPIPHQTIHRM